MSHFIVKILVTALLVAGASELARRSTLAGAVLVSLPLTSLLAMIWLWRESHDVARIAAFSGDILWLIAPSVLVFIIVPLALRFGCGFWMSLAAGITATALGYAATLALRNTLT